MNKPKESKSVPGKSGVERPALLFQFETSAVDLEGCPRDAFPEIAIVGRSNAGKSSLINALANSRIAKVSSTPGKTRLLNFYKAPRYRLVDMPGYGFAARAGAEQYSWQRMVESFLAIRENLLGLILVMDIRRDWTDDEENLLDWLEPRELPCVVVLTKADKLSRSAMFQHVNKVKINSRIDSVFTASALKRQGLFEIEDYIYKTWISATGKREPK